jgi:hypothetical protein
MSQPKETVTRWENGKLVERDDDDAPWLDRLVHKFIKREAAIARTAREFGLNPNDPNDCRILLRRLANNEKPQKRRGRPNDDAAMAQLIQDVLELRKKGHPSGMSPYTIADILTSEFPEHYPNNDARGRPNEKALNLLYKLKRQYSL